MSNTKDKRDVYYIPPNFLTSGRLFGGMIRMRNAIEGCALVVLTGFPIINLPFSLSIRIIILCLITLPLGVFGVIGIDGDSLTEFAINWVRWLKNRRVLYRSDVPAQASPSKTVRNIRHAEVTHQPPSNWASRSSAQTTIGGAVSRNPSGINGRVPKHLLHLQKKYRCTKTGKVEWRRIWCQSRISATGSFI